ncbi:hypothetical protein [Cohaesibacter haloalkalitolerans]|uniref:hypothetical protein n=1 Tax=Cohaesibacter haloalkalitolerans TaxID=1162980 RepID=UPI000E65C157|nr:hypothetical protein [Cohaesibacter haloalkalitolerans]
MPHQKAIETLERFTLLPVSKASLCASFALLYLTRTGLRLTEDPLYTESMKGVVSRTQHGVDLGWDFETGFILSHATGQRKIVLRSSHADLEAIRYFIEVEDIVPQTETPLKLRVSIPLEISGEEDIRHALSSAAVIFENDREQIH